MWEKKFLWQGLLLFIRSVILVGVGTSSAEYDPSNCTPYSGAQLPLDVRLVAGSTGIPPAVVSSTLQTRYGDATRLYVEALLDGIGWRLLDNTMSTGVQYSVSTSSLGVNGLDFSGRVVAGRSIFIPPTNGAPAHVSVEDYVSGRGILYLNVALAGSDPTSRACSTHQEYFVDFTSGPRPSISVLSPRGGEEWSVGSWQPIAWSSVAIPASASLNIWYSRTSDPRAALLGADIPIASSGFLWRIPSEVGAGFRLYFSTARTTAYAEATSSPFGIVSGGTPSGQIQITVQRDPLSTGTSSVFFGGRTCSVYPCVFTPSPGIDAILTALPAFGSTVTWFSGCSVTDGNDCMIRNIVTSTTVVFRSQSVPTIDFGDAPSPYPTTLAENGARHQLGSAVFLGRCVDGESNGLQSKVVCGDGMTKGVLRLALMMEQS